MKINIYGVYFSGKDPTQVTISFKDQDDPYDMVGYKYIYYLKDGIWRLHVPGFKTVPIHPLEFLNVDQEYYHELGLIRFSADNKQYVFIGTQWLLCTELL